MKYSQINLENYGGFDVEFPLSDVEFFARVKNDIDLLNVDPKKFEKNLKMSLEYADKNVMYFNSTDSCEGPKWDFLREALVDGTCKLTAKYSTKK
jgi:hypothetical protein